MDDIMQTLSQFEFPVSPDGGKSRYCSIGMLSVIYNTLRQLAQRLKQLKGCPSYSTFSFNIGGFLENKSNKLTLPPTAPVKIFITKI